MQVTFLEWRGGAGTQEGLGGLIGKVSALSLAPGCNSDYLVQAGVHEIIKSVLAFEELLSWGR